MMRSSRTSLLFLSFGIQTHLLPFFSIILQSMMKTMLLTKQEKIQQKKWSDQNEEKE